MGADMSVDLVIDNQVAHKLLERSISLHYTYCSFSTCCFMSLMLRSLLFLLTYASNYFDTRVRHVHKYF